MNAHNWQPGDVGVLNNHEPYGPFVFCTALGFTWVDGSTSRITPHYSYSVRPVLVIDPENREQVARLRDLIDPSQTFRPVAHYQAALRELSRPASAA